MSDYVPGEGPIPSRIAFVGEAPAREEVRLGRPFVGKSGDILWQLALRLADISRADVYVTNLKKEPFTEKETKDGLTNADFLRLSADLDDELETVQPKFVLALGRWSAWALMGGRLPMEYLHGLGFSRQGRVVVPAFHPAGALYNPDQLKYTAADLQAFARIVRGEQAPWQPDLLEKHYYLVDPSMWFPGQPGLTHLAVDTEGSVRDPIGLSFSDKAGRGGFIQADDTVSLGRFRDTLATVRPTLIFHYAIHDIEVLRSMGIDVPQLGLDYIDTSLYSYSLPTEPNGLKPLAFRHLGVERESYEELVGRHYDAAMRPYLSRALELTAPAVLGHTKTGKPKLDKASPTHRLLRRLHTDLMKGKPVDLKARWDGWAIDRRVDVIEVMLADGQLSPEYSLRVVPEQEMVDYAAADADDTLRLYTTLAGKVDMQAAGTRAMDLAKTPMFERMTHVGLTVDLPAVEALRVQLEAELESELIVIQTLVDDPEFNPRSGDDIAEWAFTECRQRGKLCIEKRTKSKVRAATDKKTLAALQADHPAVGAILRYKERQKLLDAYVRPLPRFVGPDGRLHPNWRLTVVPTGRAAANDPNVMAFPVRSELGKAVRNTIIAPPGYLLGSWDLSQIELRVLAHETQDAIMLQAFREGRDLHDETQKRFGLPRIPAKTFNFLIVYGGGAEKAASELLAQGVQGYDVQACEEIIRDWYKLYQGAAEYKLRVEQEMLLTGGSRTAGGRSRPLPAVYLSGHRWPNAMLREEAVRQGVNHKIQGRAVEEIVDIQIHLWQETLPLLWDMQVDVQPLLQIHDELIFQFPEDMWDLVNPLILEQMTANRGGLSVPVLASSSKGRAWGELK